MDSSTNSGPVSDPGSDPILPSNSHFPNPQTQTNINVDENVENDDKNCEISGISEVSKQLESSSLSYNKPPQTLVNTVILISLISYINPCNYGLGPGKGSESPKNYRH